MEVITDGREKPKETHTAPAYADRWAVHPVYLRRCNPHQSRIHLPHGSTPWAIRLGMAHRVCGSFQTAV